MIVTEPDGARVEADIDELTLVHVRSNDHGDGESSRWIMMEDARRTSSSARFHNPLPARRR